MMEPRDFICEYCIDDVVLKEGFKDGFTLVKCFWCHAKQVRALPLEDLGCDFRELVEGAYDSDEIGEPLHELLFDDWRIFSRRLKRQPSEVRRELVFALLTEGVRAKELCLYPDYAGCFVSKPSRLVENWVCELERFLSGEGRNVIPVAVEQVENCDDGSLPSVELDLPSEFEIVLEDLSSSLPEGATFWRARRYERKYKTRFGPEDVKAPPPDCAKAGRANQRGEPVLYLASDAKTAIAEVRGWKGWPIVLAEFHLKEAVRVVDTTEVESLRPVSPFEDGFHWKADLLQLLLQLRSELCRPVSPDDEQALYRPTQRFCELVRRHGYGGLKYPSAMGQGFNLVLFDRNAAAPKEIGHVRVAGVSYRVRSLGAGEALFDEQPYDYLLDEKPR
ncbi:MAG: RES family NAD+ phosphorylase [Verrucomicrobia bacterium]|nr:RES family NAD+ phosphorylase [Verrucomicrobiota bacterium]